jgi:hypothetical protein
MGLNNESDLFGGFGPIASSQPTFAQGIGRSGSFAPVWTNEIELRPRSISSIAPTTNKLPWQVTLIPSGSTYNGTIYPGFVASIFPSNIFSTFNVSSSLTYWICTVTTNGRQITSAQISTSASPPAAQTLIASSLPTTARFAFAITQGGIVYRTIGDGNPIVSINQVVITDKATAPPPGIPGVDRWYQILFS